MRRSKSSTNIPLPNRESGLMKRSRSKSSIRSSNTPLKRDNRNPSVERKLSSKYLTPRPGSYALSTPSSAGSLARGFSPAVSPSGRKNMQKQWNDKKWVHVQYQKVQNFVLESGLFEPGVADTLKPPSLSSFVYVVNVLFSELFSNFSKVNLNTVNYKEVVINHLKFLRYPALPSPSVLKIANTMHAWPQVIAMFSWLIDKVTLSSQEFHPNFTDDKTRQTHLMSQCIFDHLLRKYNAFNKNTDEDQQHIDEEFKRKHAETLGIDFDNYETLRNTLENNQGYKEELQNEVKKKIEANLEIQSDISRMRDEIEDFEQGKTETLLEEELKSVKSAKEKLHKEKILRKENICKLQEIVRTQLHSQKDVRELSGKIEDLKRMINRRKNNINEIRKIKDDLDNQLVDRVREIEKAVDEWNMSLLKTLRPELKALLLRDKGFTAKEFLQEIHDVIEKNSRLNKQFEKDVEDSKEKINKIAFNKNKFKMELEKLTETNIRLNESIIILRKNVAVLEEEKNRIKSAIETEQKNHEIQVENMRKSTLKDVTSKENLLIELKQKKQNLSKELKLFAEKSVLFFLDQNVEWKKTVRNMENVMVKLENSLSENAFKLSQQLEQENNSFKGMVELLNDLNSL